MREGTNLSILQEEDEESALETPSNYTYASLTPEEKAYNDWLAKWGDVDFTNLKFLPKVKTNA